MCILFNCKYECNNYIITYHYFYITTTHNNNNNNNNNNNSNNNNNNYSDNYNIDSCMQDTYIEVKINMK